ncbi:MAG: metallophosphoesterase [Candidatus Kaiserbacteria bacterium]|nr:metallophosphoesterase [Candidatus Kaiserbacteria bacterium]
MPRLYVILIFVCIILCILSFGILSIFEFLLHSFSNASPFFFVLLLSLLCFCTFGFIAMSVVSQYYYNTVSRALYTLSAIWMGLFAYLLMGSALGSVGEMIFGIYGQQAREVIGVVVVLGACIVTWYGVRRAKQIYTHSVSVTIPNLPAAWKGKKAVWVSDLHLGQIYGSKHAQKVVSSIQSLSPDIVFVGGDVFDGTKAPDLHVLVAPFKTVKPSEGIYYITGNHEEFGDKTIFLDAIRGSGMQVLMDECRTINGMQIIGVDYAHASKEKDFRMLLKNIAYDPALPSILLKHEPKHLDVAEDAGISLQISGHTHRAQMWPLEYIARLAYKGYSYGLKSYGKMHVLVSSGAGTWGPPLRVGTESEVVLITFT